MQLSEINIRDPFILVHNNTYYMYGSRVAVQKGFDVYESTDLENWSEPKSVFEYYNGFWGVTDFWAPEVHEYNGKFYMFASFKPQNGYRGTGILVCDTPNGTFTDWSNGPITPTDWASLDGTFYVENNVPYMVFCHEHAQILDGTVCAVKLSSDLKQPVDEPFLLWKATDAPWIRGINGGKNFVTDGPFAVQYEGRLAFIWASFSKTGYVEGITYSDNGKLAGKWIVSNDLLFEDNGGHGMIFKGLDGKERFIFHKPNHPALSERPCIIPLSSKEILEKCPL